MFYRTRFDYGTAKYPLAQLLTRLKAIVRLSLFFFKMATILTINTATINDVSLFDGVAQLLLRGPQTSVTGRGYGKSRNGQRSGISVPPPTYSERT